MRYAPRTVWALVAATALLLGGAALALSWVRHRERVSDARYRAKDDSLRVVSARLRDTVLVLQERERVAAARVARTDTVYRERVRTLAATTIVTEHHDTVYLDTVSAVKATVLACHETIAARDTALALCAAEKAALRSLFVTDSVRTSSTIAYLGREVARERGKARRWGWVEGGVAGVVLYQLARSLLK